MEHLHRTCLFICLLSLSVISVNAQKRSDRLDSLFNILSANDKAMGSISIMEDGKIAYRNAIGYQNIADSIPADTNTLYKIGSITKTYTATIFMQLVEENKLQLDQELSDFYPKVKNADDISLEMLLRHRSGIFNFTAEEGYLERARNPMTKKAILERIYEFEPVFEPGSKFEYSNSNYLLLTFIIEDVTQRSFGEVLKRRIKSKLALDHTYYDFPGTRTLSYYPAGPWKKAADTDNSVPRGAGAIVASATDVSKFFHALFNDELISDESLEKMKELKGKSGIGLYQIPFYELTAYGHTGGIDGFRSQAAYFPSKDVSIAYLSNGVSYPLNDIMIKVLEIFFKKEFKYPDFSGMYDHTATELKGFTGNYTSAQFPLDLSIVYEKGQLKGQATGQPEFPLKAVDKYTFEYEQAGIKIKFDPENATLTLQQMGQSFKFSKE